MSKGAGAEQERGTGLWTGGSTHQTSSRESVPREGGEVRRERRAGKVESARGAEGQSRRGGAAPYWDEATARPGYSGPHSGQV